MDLISRQAAIDALEELDWYHQNINKDMVSGANSAEHQAWYKADDVYKTIEEMPTIEPVVRCKDCKHRPYGKGEYDELLFPDDICPCQCDDFFYSWIPDDNWFCKNGERKGE